MFIRDLLFVCESVTDICFLLISYLFYFWHEMKQNQISDISTIVVIKIKKAHYDFS